MEIFASVDPTSGRVAVSDLVSFVAAKVDGVWIEDKVFSVDDFKDNFFPVRDEAEANKLLNEAKASLSVKPQEDK